MGRAPSREEVNVAAPRGRPFAKGNPGRKPGSKNRATRVADELLDGEAEELVRTATALAKAGNVVMLKFLLGRILPKERLVRVDLPIDGDFDAVDATRTILNAAFIGQIGPTEASALASTVVGYARTLEINELGARLTTLEERLAVLETPIP